MAKNGSEQNNGTLRIIVPLAALALSGLGLVFMGAKAGHDTNAQSIKTVVDSQAAQQRQLEAISVRLESFATTQAAIRKEIENIIAQQSRMLAKMDADDVSEIGYAKQFSSVWEKADEFDDRIGELDKKLQMELGKDQQRVADALKNLDKQLQTEDDALRAVHQVEIDP